MKLKIILAKKKLTPSFCRVLAERLFLWYLPISVAVRLYLRHFSVSKVGKRYKELLEIWTDKKLELLIMRNNCLLSLGK